MAAVTICSDLESKRIKSVKVSIWTWSVVSDSLQSHELYSPWNCTARILEWVAFPLSRGSSQPRDQTWVSHIAGRLLTIWAIRNAPKWSCNMIVIHILVLDANKLALFNWSASRAVLSGRNSTGAGVLGLSFPSCLWYSVAGWSWASHLSFLYRENGATSN